MAIHIEDQNHSVVGYIEGNRIENENHATVIYIEGNNIQNENHETIAYVNGNKVEDENHATLCYINGNKIENVNHATIGYIVGTATDIQKGAGGLWLLTMIISSGDPNNISGTISSSSAKEKPKGCLGWLGAYIFLLAKSWGGRIGLIVGGIVVIIIIATGGGLDFLNTALISLFSILVCGTIGAAIGGIVNFIKKLVNKNK